jgi:hypothetical protein
MLNNAFQVTVWLAIFCHTAYHVQAKTVSGGAGEAVCTKNGNFAVVATRECCDQIDHNAYFSVFFGECWARGGPWHKSIRYQDFAECCARRPDADGSSSNRYAFLKLGVQPDEIYRGPPIRSYDGPGARKGTRRAIDDDAEIVTAPDGLRVELRDDPA